MNKERAMEIANSVPVSEHHSKCNFRTSYGAAGCNCQVLMEHPEVRYGAPEGVEVKVANRQVLPLLVSGVQYSFMDDLRNAIANGYQPEGQMQVTPFGESHMYHLLMIKIVEEDAGNG